MLPAPVDIERCVTLNRNSANPSDRSTAPRRPRTVWSTASRGVAAAGSALAVMLLATACTTASAAVSDPSSTVPSASTGEAHVPAPAGEDARVPSVPADTAPEPAAPTEASPVPSVPTDVTAEPSTAPSPAPAPTDRGASKPAPADQTEPRPVPTVPGESPRLAVTG